MTYRQPFHGYYPITQRYGETVTDPKGHTGIDYALPNGTPVIASDDGLVVFAGKDNTGYGNMVILQHNDGNATLYAHLSGIGVVLRQKVTQGQLIGLSGSTGNSTGPHLHFEARKKWNDFKSHFDPMRLPLMSVDGAALKQQEPEPCCLKAADRFREGELLKVTAPLGAKGFANDAFDHYTPYPQNTQVFYTGQTVEHNGYTYMKVIPLIRPVWMAVNDGETQIIDR